MKRLTRDLKRALNALAAQDAGDYLPRSQKLDILGMPTASDQEETPVGRPLVAEHIKQIVVMLGDSGIEGILNYAIELCTQQHAQLHLVLHHAGAACSESLKSRLNAKGISHLCTTLPAANSRELLDLLESHNPTDYLVAAADDQLVRAVVTLPEMDSRTRIILMERERDDSKRVA